MPQVAYENPFQLFLMKNTLILFKIEISSTKTMRSPDSLVGRGSRWHGFYWMELRYPTVWSQHNLSSQSEEAGWIWTWRLFSSYCFYKYSSITVHLLESFPRRKNWVCRVEFWVLARGRGGVRGGEQPSFWPAFSIGPDFVAGFCCWILLLMQVVHCALPTQFLEFILSPFSLYHLSGSLPACLCQTSCSQRSASCWCLWWSGCYCHLHSAGLCPDYFSVT